MNERRASRRHKSFLRGIVYFDKRRSEMACLIRDLSEDGARIILSETVAIPDMIELHIPQRELTVPARMQWRRADEIGLAFCKAETATSPREDQLIRRIAELEAEVATLQRTIKRLSERTPAQAATKPPRPSTKHPLTLKVDHLPRLGQGECHRVVERRKGVGADEAVLLAYAADLALDRARRLILAVGFERRRANDEPLILDRFRDLFLGRRCELSK